MIVVDVGCHPQGPEESVYKLVGKYAPDLLLGFDPFPELKEGTEVTPGGTVIIRRQLAAWIHDGYVPFQIDGICSGVDAEAMAAVECFDLNRLIRTLPAGDIILKLDCEGAEYGLLRRLADENLDERLSLVLVEWHPPDTAHGYFVPPDVRPVLRCPVEEWG